MAVAQKNRRIDIRIKESQKKVLSYAASLRHQNLSNFVLHSALREAEYALAEKVHFQLSEAKWKEFCTALDSPAKEIPQLKQLFEGPKLFHE